jgi:Papain-like cysteine protease AvrRpt2
MASVELDVDYIKQETPTTCWNAGYKMMLRWTCMYESMADNLPNDKQMRDRGILDGEFLTCRRRLGLQSANYEDLGTPDGLAKILEEHGPIWVAGYWATDFTMKGKPDFKHIVIIRGVKTHVFSEDEVYVNDPYRGYSGAAAAPSWWGWSRFWNKLHKVPDNCQYWK